MSLAVYEKLGLSRRWHPAGFWITYASKADTEKASLAGMALKPW